MHNKQPMRDLIVVIPGIMGSVLAIDGRTVWGPGAILPNLRSLGREIDRLKLPTDIGDEEARDGVVATALMPDLHLLPGVWTIDGYTKVTRHLRQRFDIYDDPPNLIEFPYDWRLSNAASARRLARVALPALERWRKFSAEPDAKLILICHSMGGLVARYFLEHKDLQGRDYTRRLITIGTPYQGSINALDAISNGLSKRLGPLQLDLTDFARSLPSLYQLLPTYPCIEAKPAQYLPLAASVVSNVCPTRVAAALDFHRLATPATPAPYKITAIKGHIQPTAQSARTTTTGIEPLYKYKGVDRQGDGTVPRPSSHPTEWEDESVSTIFAGQLHGSLQNGDDVLQQIYGALTGQLGTWMGGRAISVEAPDVLLQGESLEIAVSSKEGEDRLPLQAQLVSEDGVAIASEILNNQGHGNYALTFPAPLPAGAYRITVDSADPGTPVDAVTAITLVCENQ